MIMNDYLLTKSVLQILGILFGKGGKVLPAQYKSGSAYCWGLSIGFCVPLPAVGLVTDVLLTSEMLLVQA